MTRFGGASSHVLTDPRCGRFRVPFVNGVIAYRESPRCRVAVGDPVCHPDSVDELAEYFRLACEREGRSVVYAASSEAFASRCAARGYAAIEFGQELVLDPRDDRLSGKDGRELRKKVRRAEREGVAVRERGDGDDHAVEVAMRGVARAWLASRRGPQAFIAPIQLDRRQGIRCFFAIVARRMVGVLSLVRLEARHGWGIEHLLHSPDAPPGTSELLVTRALDVVAREGAVHVSFGTSPLKQLGRIHGIGDIRAAATRWVFGWGERHFALGAITHFREKFGVAKREPLFALFHPRVDLLSVGGLIRAFSAH